MYTCINKQKLPGTMPVKDVVVRFLWTTTLVSQQMEETIRKSVRSLVPVQ